MCYEKNIGWWRITGHLHAFVNVTSMKCCSVLTTEVTSLASGWLYMGWQAEYFIMWDECCVLFELLCLYKKVNDINVGFLKKKLTIAFFSKIDKINRWLICFFKRWLLFWYAFLCSIVWNKWMVWNKFI